jgi:iron-sulfur cluster assembly protein
VSTLTAAAVEVIKHSLELAKVDPSKVGVRLRVAGGEVRPRFVEGPQDGDETVDAEGIRVFIAKTIIDELGDVIVDVTAEHGRLTVRPA